MAMHTHVPSHLVMLFCKVEDFVYTRYYWPELNRVQGLERLIGRHGELVYALIAPFFADYAAFVIAMPLHAFGTNDLTIEFDVPVYTYAPLDTTLSFDSHVTDLDRYVADSLCFEMANEIAEYMGGWFSTLERPANPTNEYDIEDTDSDVEMQSYLEIHPHWVYIEGRIQLIDDNTGVSDVETEDGPDDFSYISDGEHDDEDSMIAPSLPSTLLYPPSEL